jgi:hydrogenase expression/formation protein HypE
MRPGKLPHAMLAQLLKRIAQDDPRVIVGPRVGEDAAVIDFGDRYLVAKTDPITFATDLIGWYAVNVSANDIACMGAWPRWFLGTLLLPETAEEQDIAAIFQQLGEACQHLGVTPVGGHTEVTIGLDRPILIGCMLGEVPPDGLITSAGARPGDIILLSDPIAVEGTALLAREAEEALLAQGVARRTVDRARRLLFDPGISVVFAVDSAREAGGGITALHDPTEGGLATGLAELAMASNVGLEIEEGHIRFLRATRQFSASTRSASSPPARWCWRWTPSGPTPSSTPSSFTASTRPASAAPCRRRRERGSSAKTARASRSPCSPRMSWRGSLRGGRPLLSS